MPLIDDPRAKLLIANHGRRVMIALAVAGLLALIVAAGIALTPPTTMATEQTDRQTIETTGAVSADVVDEEEWDGISDDGSTYLIDASPVVDIEPRTTAPDGTEVTHRATVQIEGSRDGDVFWYEEKVLAKEAVTVEDGEATSSVSIDVVDLQQDLADLQQRLAGVGSVQTSVHLQTEYDTGRYQGDLSTSSNLIVTDRAYWFESDLSDSASPDTTVTVERTESPNWLAVSLSGLVGLLLLTGAGTVRAADPESMDIDAIKQEIHRRRYADWISTGSIPMWVGNNYIELDTLEDVVDVAIDTKERVVHDRRRDLFAVITGNVVYYYSKIGNWDEGAWPSMDLPEPDESVNVGGGTMDPPGGSPRDEEPEESEDSDDGPGNWDEDVWQDL
ncbi:DUF5305 domain-containing protein [Natronoarchaeum sp. GCM10025321]|uniref:DUF5305 domain-containing protein n=1 Tax=Natronoarchaeum sp. GCM10025321 TaxID=3252684 RepID=UPI003622C09B